MCLGALIGCHRAGGDTKAAGSAEPSKPLSEKVPEHRVPPKEPVVPTAPTQTYIGPVTAVTNQAKITGVLGLPDKWQIGDGNPNLQASVGPKDGKSWLVIHFAATEKELSFDLNDFTLTVPSEPEPIICWAISPDAGKHFVFDITRMAPAEKAKLQAATITPAAAFEIPVNDKSGKLRVKEVEVPLKW
jgi:hypothetical protein